MVSLQNMIKTNLEQHINTTSNITTLSYNYKTDELVYGDMDDFINTYSEFLEYMNDLYVDRRKYTNKDYRNFAIRLLNKRETVTFACIVNNCIIAFVNIGFNFINKSVRINEIFVREKYRHQGIGTKLLKMVENVAVNDSYLDNLELSVNNNNEIAKNFYLKCGFKFK